MSIAERRPVPLNSRCSRKCVEPWCPFASSREPTPSQQPSVAERWPGMASVRTRTPPGRTVRRTTAPPTSPATTCSRDPEGVSGRGMPLTSAVTSDVRLGRLLLGVGRRLGATLALRQHRDERQLAARVDLGDLDLHLRADAQDVL